MSHPAYQIIESARSELKVWAGNVGVPIHRFEFVAMFEPWSDSHALWVFYPTDKELAKFNKDGTSEKVKQEYQTILKACQFPFSEFSQVYFEFDSDENVRKNYSGNYFFRLR